MRTGNMTPDQQIAEWRSKGLQIEERGFVHSVRPSKAPSAEQKVLPPSTRFAPAQSLWIPEWTPATLNKVLHGHWSNGSRLKKADRFKIEDAFARAGLIQAKGPRRLSFIVILPKGKRFPDRDSFWKSLKDALAACGGLVDDTPRLCLDGQAHYARAFDGDVWGTLILLSDLNH